MIREACRSAVSTRILCLSLSPGRQNSGWVIGIRSCSRTTLGIEAALSEVRMPGVFRLVWPTLK